MGNRHIWTVIGIALAALLGVSGLVVVCFAVMLTIIGAIAILGRGMLLLLLAHLSMVQAGWAAWRYDATIGALAVLIGGQAVSMARHGPVTSTTIPADWDTPGAGDAQSSSPPGLAGTSTACS